MSANLSANTTSIIQKASVISILSTVTCFDDMTLPVLQEVFRSFTYDIVLISQYKTSPLQVKLLHSKSYLSVKVLSAKCTDENIYDEI